MPNRKFQTVTISLIQIIFLKFIRKPLIYNENNLNSILEIIIRQLNLKPILVLPLEVLIFLTPK